MRIPPAVSVPVLIALCSATARPGALEKRFEGRMCGIGVQIGKHAQGLLIRGIIVGGPSEGAGLGVGEIITAIDGASAAPLSIQAAVRQLVGPEESKVTLRVRNSAGEERDVTITRRVFVVSLVESRIHGAGVGLLRISGFNKETPAAVASALTTLRAKGAKALIVNLVECSGGLYPEVCRVAAMLLPEGRAWHVWSIRRDGRESEARIEGRGQETAEWPVVIIIGKATAGAGELLAAALKDCRGATAMGQRTAGTAALKSLREGSGDVRQIDVIGDFVFPRTGKTGRDGIEPDIVLPAGTTSEAACDKAMDRLQDALSKGTR